MAAQNHEKANFHGMVGEFPFSEHRISISEHRFLDGLRRVLLVRMQFLEKFTFSQQREFLFLSAAFFFFEHKDLGFSEC